MPARTDKLRATLTAAQQKKLIVKFSRPFELGSYAGFVLAIGQKFFLLAVLDESFQFEQYSFLRIGDVRHLEAPAKFADVYKAAQKRRGDPMPRKFKVDPTDSCSVLRSLGSQVVTIHSENVAPESCNIGVVTSDNRIHYEMFEIGPDAKWSTRPTYFRLNEITRIDLRGPYESALLLVGGEPDYDAIARTLNTLTKPAPQKPNRRPTKS